MSAEEKKALKEKHRLELVMQESGEQFEQDAKRRELWRSITTPGLVVNIQRQVFDYSDGPGGDVFTWLIQRNGWTFPQAIRYLQKRTSDPIQEVKPQAQPTKAVHVMLRRHESKVRDLEKEQSGLYECGIGSRKGKTFFFYLPKPMDKLQEQALKIGGEKMRDYFSWEAWKLREVRDGQYHRFQPVIELWIDYCEECEEPIQWATKQKPQFSREPIPGTAEWRQIRIYPTEVYAYRVIDEDEDSLTICENCKRRHENFYFALDLLYKSAYKRETKTERIQEHEIFQAPQ